MSKHARIKIKQVQVQAQWTDAGRRFAQVDGYSQSGAMDALHFKLANALLGNDLHTPVIEVLLGHFSFTVDEQIVCCICGAQANLSKKGIKSSEILTFNVPFILKPNETLHLDAIENGLYCYIAFAGIAQLDSVKGSVCAVRRERSGGLKNDGEGLKPGDEIKLKRAKYSAVKEVNLCTKIPSLSQAIRKMQDAQHSKVKQIPVIFSYQHMLFSLQDKTQFLCQKYKVTQQIDRMGVRLQGQALDLGKMKLLSQGIAKGSVQISGDGMPIIMRNDRQTIGGYPIIATVTGIGMSILSQAKPSDEIHFVDSDIDGSLVQMRLLHHSLENISTKQRSLRLNSSKPSAEDHSK